MTTRRRQQSQLGRRIVDFRGELTQKQLAQRAGVSVALVRALEQGWHENPRLSTLRKIAEVLQVTLVDLLCDE